MRGTPDAALIFVEIELGGKGFHGRIVIRSVVKRVVPDSEAILWLTLSVC